MNGRKKLPTTQTKTPAYRQAFARLDAALGENKRSRSNELEKINRLRLAVFGSLTESAKILK